ncbi:hypothetical protein IT571_11685 [Candidatus Sumerlaeota bacterium]|nr:hypothetical protein [Candidatus Sumerlaeota bacterium]
MNTHLFDAHTSKWINFYIIHDTNWLMNAEGGYTIYPKVPVLSKSSWFSSPDIESYILLPVAVIVPIQVKREIAKLHDEKIDHAKTSNAKRNYSVLQRHFNNRVKPYLRVQRYEAEYQESSGVFDDELLAFFESDLETVPKMKMFEDVLGPDSEVDKRIVSLARAICSLRPTNHCFIATYDTGIQAEASHLFYRNKENIGCTSYLSEWVAHVNNSAKEIVKQGGGVNAYR